MFHSIIYRFTILLSMYYRINHLNLNNKLLNDFVAFQYVKERFEVAFTYITI